MSFVSFIYITRKSLEQQRSNAHLNITKTDLALRARTQVPETVKNCHEAATAMRHCVQVCVLLGHQKSLIKNTYVMSVYHSFHSLTQTPLQVRNESIVDSTSLHHGHANAETTWQQSEMFLDRARDSTRDTSGYSSSSLDAFQTLRSSVSVSQGHEKFRRHAYLDVCSYCSHCRCGRSKNRV